MNTKVQQLVKAVAQPEKKQVKSSSAPSSGFDKQLKGIEAEYFPGKKETKTASAPTITVPVYLLGTGVIDKYRGMNPILEFDVTGSMKPVISAERDDFYIANMRSKIAGYQLFIDASLKKPNSTVQFSETVDEILRNTKGRSDSELVAAISRVMEDRFNRVNAILSNMSIKIKYLNPSSSTMKKEFGNQETIGTTSTEVTGATAPGSCKKKCERKIKIGKTVDTDVIDPVCRENESDCGGGQSPGTQVGEIDRRCLITYDDGWEPMAAQFDQNTLSYKETWKKNENCIELQTVGPIQIEGVAKEHVNTCINKALNSNKFVRAVGLVAAVAADVGSSGATGGGGVTAAYVLSLVTTISNEAIDCITDTDKFLENAEASLKKQFKSTINKKVTVKTWTVMQTPGIDDVKTFLEQFSHNPGKALEGLFGSQFDKFSNLLPGQMHTDFENFRNNLDNNVRNGIGGLANALPGPIREALQGKIQLPNNQLPNFGNLPVLPGLPGGPQLPNLPLPNLPNIPVPNIPTPKVGSDQQTCLGDACITGVKLW